MESPLLKSTATPSWAKLKKRVASPVISTRVRLVRNLEGLPFPSKCTMDEKRKVFEKITSVASRITRLSGYEYFNFNGMERLEQMLLHEKRAASESIVFAEGDRGVIAHPDASVSITINDANHLTISAIAPGVNPLAPYQLVNEIDDCFSKFLSYAHDPKFGYLAASPLSTGTGLKVSYLVHLPSLILTRTVDSVLNGASHMGMAAKAFISDYQEVTGSLFLLSTYGSMGLNEDEAIAGSLETVTKILTYEQEAQAKICSEAWGELEDKAYRAFGIIRYAQMLQFDELLSLLSVMRMAYASGLRLVNASVSLLNALMIEGMPAHVQKRLVNHMQTSSEVILPDDPESRMRALLVRKRLKLEEE